MQLQDFTEWECIVVDEGSTDDTVAVAQGFVDADCRFRLVTHARSLGLSAARNTGIALANADYVCFLDDDDFLLDGSLRARVDALDAAGIDVAGAYCDWINTDPEVQLEAFRPRRAPVERGIVTFTTLRDSTPFIATSPLVRWSTLAEVGGFDETLRRGEDADLWLRILRLGFRFVDARHLGVAYRRSPGSMVTGDPAAQLEVLTAIRQQMDAPAPELRGHGPLPAVEPLRALIPESVRAGETYRYLAMIAVRDLERAISLGRAAVPEAVRDEITPDLLAAELGQYVRARLSLRDGEEVLRAMVSVEQMVLALLPNPAASWTSMVEPDHWTADRRGRARAIGGTPVEVPATRSRVAGTVVLIVEAAYHVDEFGPLADELERRGQRVCFMLSPKTTAPARAALGAYTHEVVSFDVDVIRHAAAVVVLNDWGPVRELVIEANAHAVPTFAKVEGVQDFEDVDTGRVRSPYRMAAVVLGQGTNDLESLPDKCVEIVGSTRLERIWNSEPVTPTGRVLVNLNFTYHVLTEHREEWIRSIKRATRKVGAPVLVSAHPADHTRSIGLEFATKPFRHEITRAGVLISRFSTVPFEAMARGVPFIYHNPHGELVPTFKQPAGAFPITTGEADLAAALRDILGSSRAPQRDSWADFFLRQVDVDADRSSESRTADVILARL